MRGKQQTKDSKPTPRLVVPRDKAATIIQNQIVKGENLKVRSIQSMEEFDVVQKEYVRWDDFNREMLRGIFDQESISDEYSHWVVIGIPTFPPPLGQKIKDFQESLSNKTNRLQSVLERLELYAEPIPSRSTEMVRGGTGGNQRQENNQVINKRVFLVHGHDEAAKLNVARTLDKLGLEPVILDEQPSQGRTIIEKCEQETNVGFAVVLMTPDDEGRKRGIDGDLVPRARQNVIFELGYLIGKLGRSRVCALYTEGVEIPSDYYGVGYIPLDPHRGWQSRLVQELHAGGISVDANRLSRP